MPADPSPPLPTSPSPSPVESAAPATGPRVLAVAAITVAGLCGGLIGYGVVDLQGGGPVANAVGALVGAVAAAAGVAVVAVLVLRAMTEWRSIEERDAATGGRPPRGPGRPPSRR